MASIFKQKYTVAGKNGERIRKQSQSWYIDYKAANGTRKRVKAFKDKQATAQLAAKLEKESELAQAGIVDKYKKHRLRPLAEHLEDFKQSLIAKGNTFKHTNLVYTRAKKVIEGCKFALWSDISASSVQKYLAELRKDKVVEEKAGLDKTDKKIKQGISAQTFNFYLQAVKQFCRWMVQDQRASESPLQHLQKINVKADRRHDRRALEPAEIQKLLSAAVSAPERFGMLGYDRALLYRFAVETGLRASEIRSLTVSSLDFENQTVMVNAAYCKNRKQAIIPLKENTALLIKESLAGKLSQTEVFSMPSENYLAKMLKADLEAAGIEYVDDAGRYADFHALRHSMGSLLAASGVHPKIAQSLMRHSDINLTLSRYSHVFSGQESEAIEKLPDFSLTDTSRQKATGTDGKAIQDDKNAYKPAYKKLAKNAYSGLDQSSLFGTDKKTNQGESKDFHVCHNLLNSEQLGNKKTPLSSIDNDVLPTEEEGFEPPVPCGTAVFKTATLSHSVTPPGLSIQAFGSQRRQKRRTLQPGLSRQSEILTNWPVRVNPLLENYHKPNFG